MLLVARVVIDSPLPQLDRLFDYEIPAELTAQVRIGVRVKVPFGRAKTLNDGFVVAIESSSEFDGKLAQVAEVVSIAPVLDPQIYLLARAVADRQAATVSDVLRHAVPARSVAVEKRWLADETEGVVIDAARVQTEPAVRQARMVSPITTELGPVWVTELVDQALRTFADGKSVLISVPDFRDQKLLLDALGRSVAAAQVIDYGSDQKLSARYSAFLKCLTNQPWIVVGSRSAIYAPVKHLGLIIVWDDGDPSHLEPSSPYSHTREVALIRQKISSSDLLFASHTRSTEIQRLIEMGYLEDTTGPLVTPQISTLDREVRVDGVAWNAIREGLKLGPVLVQVAAKGIAVSSYCAACGERALCHKCHGPLWLDNKGHARCRWCNLSNMNFRCAACSGQKLRSGTPGTTRTIEEFGRGFPGTRIIESTAEHRKESIESGTSLVISTPGAEPRALGGYAAVVILDANQALNRDSLKAAEDALRQWANAISMATPSANCIVVGLRGDLAKILADWQPAKFASQELRSRRELRFPPALRLASVSAEQALLVQVLDNLKVLPGVEILGPMPIYEKNVLISWKAFLKYEYSQGESLANSLKAAMLLHSAGHTAYSAKSGRAVRPIRVKMDDSEVI